MALKGIRTINLSGKLPGAATRSVASGRTLAPSAARQGVPVQYEQRDANPLRPLVHPQSAGNVIARFAQTSQDFHAAHRRDAHEHLGELVLDASAERETTVDEILQSTVSRLAPITVVEKFKASRAGDIRLQESLFIQQKWHELGENRFSVSAWLHEAQREGVREGFVHDFLSFLTEAGLVKLTSEQVSLMARENRRVAARGLPEAAFTQARAFARWLTEQGYSKVTVASLPSRLRVIFELAGEDWNNLSALEQLVGGLANKMRSSEFKHVLKLYREFTDQTETKPHQSLLDNFEDWLQAQGKSYQVRRNHIEKIADTLASIDEDASYEEVLELLAEKARHEPGNGEFASTIFRRFANFMKVTERVAEIPDGLKPRFADDPDGPFKKRLLSQFYRWLQGREKYPEASANRIFYVLSAFLTELGHAWRRPSQLMQQAGLCDHAAINKSAVRIFCRFLFEWGYLKKTPTFASKSKRELPGSRNLTPVSEGAKEILESFEAWICESGYSGNKQTRMNYVSVLRRASRELGENWQDSQLLLDWAARAKTPAMKVLSRHVVRLFLRFLMSC
jgi:hypothetical protein